MLKVHYREALPLIRDRSWDPRVSGQVLLSFRAPMVITSLLFALYSMLIIYCVLPSMHVMHDALGRVGDPILHHLPGLAPNHWKPDIEMLKGHYGEKSPLIKPHRGSILGLLGLWVGAVGSRHSSTRGVPSFQHPWLSLHCCCLYTQYSLFTVSYFV